MPHLDPIIDETSKILEDINQILGSLNRSTNQLQSSSDQINNTLKFFPFGSFGRSFSFSQAMKSINSFGRSAATRTYDIEMIFSQAKLSKMVGSVSFNTIMVQDGDYKITAVPKGTPKIGWFDVPSIGFPMFDCLWVESRWLIRSSESEDRDIFIYSQLTLKIDDKDNSMSFVQVAAPLFLSIDHSSLDTIANFPIEERSRIRAQVFNEITKAISAQKIQVPKIDSGNLGLTMQPHFFSIAGKLSLASRSLPKRRTSIPLGTLWFGDDQVIRIKREHIEPTLREMIKQPDVEVTGLDFRFSDVLVKIHHREERDILHIHVTVDVDADYSLSIVESSPAVLIAKLELLGYETHTHADRCWPICDRVLNDAQRETDDEMGRRKLFTFPFADLRFQASRAWVRIMPFGFEIHTTI